MPEADLDPACDRDNDYDARPSDGPFGDFDPADPEPDGPQAHDVEPRGDWSTCHRPEVATEATRSVVTTRRSSTTRPTLSTGAASWSGRRCRRAMAPSSTTRSSTRRSTRPWTTPPATSRTRSTSWMSRYWTSAGRPNSLPCSTKAPRAPRPLPARPPCVFPTHEVANRAVMRGCEAGGQQATAEVATSSPGSDQRARGGLHTGRDYGDTTHFDTSIEKSRDLGAWSNRQATTSRGPTSTGS